MEPENPATQTPTEEVDPSTLEMVPEIQKQIVKFINKRKYIKAEDIVKESP